MDRHEITDTVSLGTICEPNLQGAKDCCEFALQILGALRDSSSGRLRSIIEDLVCFQLITQFPNTFSRRSDIGSPELVLRLTVLGSSTLEECLGSFFRPIPLDSEWPAIQQHFVHSLPRFLFINLLRHVWNQDHLEKDCRRIAFPLQLDMAPYALERPNRCQYQLGAVISHLGLPEESAGHYITFLMVFGQWIRFDDLSVEDVLESAALEDNFPEADGSTQTATLLLYVSDN
jgi:uncharacterized UBP type Zn finger protein